MPVIILFLLALLLPSAVSAAPCGVCNDGRSTSPCVVYVGTGGVGGCGGNDCDYTTLGSADTGEDCNIVAQTYAIEFHLYDVGGDSEQGFIYGWSTSATYDITITIPPSARGSNFGKLDTSIYYMDYSAGNGLWLYEDYITVDGFQFDSSASSYYSIRIAGQGASNAINLHNIVGDGADTTSGAAFLLTGDTDLNLTASNIIAYGYATKGIFFWNHNTASIYNATMSDMGTDGFYLQSGYSASFYNCVANANNDNWNMLGTDSGDYNACDDGCTDQPDDSGTSVDSFTDTDEFISPNSAYDFRLKTGASALPDAGNTCGSYSYGDSGIDGDSCCNTDRDIGADELACAAGAARRIFLIH